MTPLLGRAIIHSMIATDRNHPVRVLFNYWEIPPTWIARRLDSLVEQGVNRVISFVPWQALETDISHALSRFLQASFERNIYVSLIATPEPGIHFPLAGIPKDLLSKTDILALSSQNEPYGVALAPQFFSIPSPFSSEYQKRFQNYLARFDAVIANLVREEPRLADFLEIRLSGGFWKYFRSPSTTALQFFRGASGDFSPAANLKYRQTLEKFFQQPEFLEPNPTAAQKWKTQAMDEFNRKWFYQRMEAEDRSKTRAALGKRMSSLEVTPSEVFTPEADPAFFYPQLMQWISEKGADFTCLSAYLGEAACRASCVDSNPASPLLAWTGVGGFAALSMAEKQFLIWKSILLFGTEGGAVLIPEEEWLGFSKGFRRKVTEISDLVTEEGMRIPRKVLYLTSHLWSGAGALWNSVYLSHGKSALCVSDLSIIKMHPEADLILVDPNFILQEKTVDQLLELSAAGKCVVLPKSSLFTERAWEKVVSTTRALKKIDADFGVPYSLFPYRGGTLVIYDLDRLNGLPKNEVNNLMETFVLSLYRLIDWEDEVSLNDHRVQAMWLKNSLGNSVLFLLNETNKPITVEIRFKDKKGVSDFSSAMNELEWVSELVLEVPPTGILPLRVESVTPERDLPPDLPPHHEIRGEAWS